MCVLDWGAHTRVYGCVHSTVSLEFPGEQINWQPFAIIDFYPPHTHTNQHHVHTASNHIPPSDTHTHTLLADNKAAGRREG